jgi:peptide deformylase
MTNQSIIRAGDPRIYISAKPVVQFNNPELDVIISMLIETMRAYNGIGIAATQLGIELQIFIMGFESNPRYPGETAVPLTVLINPSYTPLSDEKIDGWEGCLSIPGLRGVVPRYRKIKYQGYDAQGHFIEQSAENLHARIVQHEYDHLHGMLYPCRMTDMRLLGFEKEVWDDVIHKRIPCYS